MAHRILKDRVSELLPCLGAPEHETPAAHVAPANERLGKSQAGAEHRKKNVGVLRGRDASQKNHGGGGPRSLGEIFRVSFERPAVARVIGIDGNLRDASKVIQSYPLFRRLQPQTRGDHQSSGNTRRGIGERPGIGELSTEVEAADEREQFSESRALGGAKSTGQVGVTPLVQEVFRSLPAQARGREEEDSPRSHVVVSRPNVVEERVPIVSLARKLRTLEYFTLAFGSMVGAGWLIIIDDWLTRGGPLGGILGFLVGSLLLVPIGLTYGRLVAGVPDAGGEVAYTERVFPRAVSFVTGWFVVLAYLVVCPWEAVAIGKLLSRVAPVLDSVEVYRFGGQPVFLYRLLLGLAVTAFICYLNFRGIRSSATFQNVCTFGLLAVFAVFSALGLARGNVSNLTPLFSHPGAGGALVSVLLILQIVPYFMTGFEAVAKSSEEAHSDFQPTGFRNAILLAIGVGGFFYATVMLVVPMVHPWTELTAIPFGTAVAFERAFGSRAIGDFILLGAVISLFKVFNGCFIAATRMVYGMGKRGLVHSSLARVHARFQTPHLAIAFVGLVTVIATFLGDALLVPLSELGSLAIAVGWLAACLCFLKGVSWSEDRPPGRSTLAMAGIGAIVALALVLMKLLPFVPGHMSWPQYLGLAVWMSLGFGLWWAAKRFHT